MNKLNELFEIYKNTPPPKYIVENLITENTLSILGAASNAGKTLIATHLMLCIAQGKSFLNLKTEKTNIAYVDLEMFRDMFCLRLSKQAKDIPDNIYYAEKIIDIKKAGETEKYIKTLKENNVGFLIIDSYSQLSAGAEENSNTDNSLLMKELYKFKQAGITTLLLHHKRKGNEEGLESLRGGSSIGAGADTVLMLSRSRDTYNIKTVKHRLIPAEKWLDVRYTYKETEQGIIEPLILNECENISLQAQIISILAQGRQTTNNLQKEVKTAKKTLTDTLRNMVDLGILEQEPKEPKQGQRIYYSLFKNEEVDID